MASHKEQLNNASFQVASLAVDRPSRRHNVPGGFFYAKKAEFQPVYSQAAFGKIRGKG